MSAGSPLRGRLSLGSSSCAKQPAPNKKAIAMNADVYACTMRGSLGDAVKRLPDWSTPKPEQLKRRVRTTILSWRFAWREAAQNPPIRLAAIQCKMMRTPNRNR